MSCLSADEGVCFGTIAPAGFRLLAALDGATRVLGVNLMIKCGTEDHPPTDPHSLGKAYDVRTKDLPKPVLLKLLAYLQQVLPPAQFTILLETPVAFTDPDLARLQYLNPHATAPHLHLQLKKGTTFPPPADPGDVRNA